MPQIDLFSFLAGLLLTGLMSAVLLVMLRRQWQFSAQQSQQAQLQQEQTERHRLELERARLEERITALEPLQRDNAELESRLESLRQQLSQYKSDYADLDARQQERETQLVKTEQRLQQNEQRLITLQEDLAKRNEQFTELETRLDAERAAYSDKLKTLEQAREQLKQEFQNLANKIFEEKSARFTEHNRENMGQLLNPLREQLGEFKRRVEDVYDKEAKDRRALYEQIGSLKQLNQQMSQDAINLTNALKGESKTQGNWGEVVLERALEESGLRKGHEFELQVSVTEDNRRYQPDAIVRLPENKDVIIDAKVSLKAYEQYCSSTDEAQRERLLREHLQSLRGHIKGLSDKAYQSLEEIRTLDFVLLFVPVEGAFLLALERDPSLFREAFDRNIMLVSPATLMVTLRTIHNIWRYEYQNRNSYEIARRGGELHDKFVGFVEAVEDIGKHLGRTQRAYDDAHKRLTSGRGNLINQVHMLQKLGADGKKKLSTSLLEEAADTDSE